MSALKAVALAATFAALMPANTTAQGSVGSESPDYGTPARRAPSRPITVGSSLESRLTASDPTFADNSHFQVWKFSARAGQDVVVALESRDFDAFVMLVEAQGEAQLPLQMETADSARTARLAMRIPSDGDYLIVANTLQSRRTGSYKLSLKTLSDACASGGPCAVEGTTNSDLTPISGIDPGSARAIALGDSQPAELARTDLRLRDSSYFDAWRYEGRSGEKIVIDHISPVFDTYLILARQTPNGPESIRENDDAPYTQNSQLAVELPETGTYVIVATSLRPDTVGRYSLRLRSMADACAAGGPCEPTAGPAQRLPLFASVRSARTAPLTLGDTVSARLSRGDPMLGDGTFFNTYRFTGTANEEVAILLSALAPDLGRFDTFLHLVRLENDSVVIVKSDDDGGVGSNSMVTARLPRSGDYIVIANGLTVADTGNYSLSLMRLSDVCASLRVCEVGAEIPQASHEATIRAASATAIALGNPVVARLESDGPKLPDGKPFQPWRYTARASERVVITNRSSDFDAYLYLYRITDDSLSEVARDDDGAGSLDAQLSVELTDAGDYVIVAGSFSTSATGEYRLTIESMSAACASGGPCAVGETSAGRARLLPAATSAYVDFPVGDTLRAALPVTAPQLPGRGRFQSYRFNGRANERIVITMDSDQFDTYLDLALVAEPSLRVIDSDDDSGEGTNSRLVAVLPEDGTYLLVASALTGDSVRGIGAYELSRGPCDDACAADDGTPAIRSDAVQRLALQAERRRIPRGGVVEDSLGATARRSPGATFHAYWLQGTAGQTLRASLQSTAFDPYLVVLRLEGDSLRRIQSDDDGGESTNSLVEWAIDRSATYVVVAGSYSGSSSGSYVLNVGQGPESEREQFAAVVAAAGARAQLGRALTAPHRLLPVGVTVSGEITEQTLRLPGRGRFQAYRFNGRASERVVVTMESGDIDPYVYLASVSGDAIRIVGTDDDGGDGVNSRLVATLPTIGEYLVVASAYGASDTARVAAYTIKLGACDDACAAQTTSETATSSDNASTRRILRAPRRTFQPGISLQSALIVGDSTLSDGSSFHAYPVDAIAGSGLRASMESSSFDPFLFLYRIEGDSLVRVAFDDDSGEETNALLEWTVDRTGSYILVANALSRNSYGEYSLNVSLSVPPPRPR